jgi:hypothetical protein
MRALQEQAAELAGKDEQKARQMAGEADKVKDAFCRAWYYADYKMTDADLWPAGPFGTGKSDDGVTCPSTEKKQAPAPSKCSCPLTTWPPPLNAADPSVDQLKCLK